MQYKEEVDSYSIWGYDGPEIHICKIWKTTVPVGTEELYSQEQNDADKTEFENSHKISCNKAIEKKQTENKALLVAIAGREGSETIWASHNFCDRTSWFGDSIRTSEVLSGSGTVFSSSYPYWIDMEHGKVLDEDGLKEDVDHGYQVVVVANGVTQSVREAFASTGGDYVVNYQSGSITFLNNSYNANEVTASFSYENGSTFYVRPTTGKALEIEEAEAQFTKDVVITDTIVFGIFGYVQVFAPQYWQGTGGPLPTNYKVELQRQSYKTIGQLVDEALGSYPVIPAIGGPDRGFSNDMYGFPFRYGTIRRIWDMYGLEVRCWLQHHNALEGERVTATFYCVSKDESSIE